MTRRIAAFSGGKDSTAMVLRMHERGEDFELMFTPTGNELPELEEHLRLISTMVGRSIITPPNRTLEEWINEFEAVPNVFQRWCTRVIKIVPCIAYLKQCTALDGELPELLVGLRADEESRIGLYGEYARYRYPLQEFGWGLQEVTDYLRDRGVSVPTRTDCAVCPYQRIGEWFALYKRHPTHFQQGVEWERQYNHTFRTPGKIRTSDGVRLSGRDTWPQKLEDLANDFSVGRIPRGYRPDGLRVITDEAEGASSEACRVCRM